MLIDTHSHLFVEEFTEDLPLVMERAQKAGVSYIFMPNIDSTTIDAMLSVCRDYPGFCYPMIGLHPTSVNESYEQELAIVHKYLSTSREFVAIGEIGLDLYWDKTFLKEQILVFEKQIEWALEYGLPIVIHSREAFEYIYKVMEPYKNTPLTGIFHSFTGTSEEAAKLLEFEGFMLGINGVVTFKKSTLPEALTTVPLERIVLETDSPYLAPVPNRGKRNESANVRDTLMKVADIYQMDPEYVAQATSVNALKVFGIRLMGDFACHSNGGLHILDEPALNVPVYPAPPSEIEKRSAPYPYYFDPTFHRYKLDQPQKWSEPRTIFVCSMADLFGKWVPDEWIEAVINACLAAPQHRYLFLTKNPVRYMHLISNGIIPENQPNFWFGSTATIPEMEFFWCDEVNTFVSIEPILAPFEDLTDEGVDPASKTNWIIVGAETGNRKNKVVPQKSWIDEIVSAAKKAGTPVFMKESLREIMGDDFKQEFPWEVNGCEH